MTTPIQKAIAGVQSARQAILAQYKHVDASPLKLITSPGKFEGEPIFVPHFWNLSLEGLADQDMGSTAIFKLKSGDPELEEWPELKAFLGRRRVLRLTETESGFIRAH